ncbi:MAG: hypothetical protein KKD48_00355 [Nanoarchaeota archaeon]|nr:hypothetical protein [Nanoarchaeota archaeon]
MIKPVRDNPKIDRKVRRILRDFWNDSYYEVEGNRFIVHAGDDPNCELCYIEKQAIKKIINLIKQIF